MVARIAMRIHAQCTFGFAFRGDGGLELEQLVDMAGVGRKLVEILESRIVNPLGPVETVCSKGNSGE